MKLRLEPAARLDARHARGAARDVVTPEGVRLGFVVASLGDRVAGFTIDFFILFGASLLLAIAGVLAVQFGGAGGVIFAFVLLGIFLLQNFYFIWFEARWSGVTPGKRKTGTRVIDARGGPLTVEAVVVRNVMRNVELWLPLIALLAPQSLWGGAPGWATLAASVWLLVFAGMPWFNKQRLRIGDMVAGTMVVLAPRAILLPDVGGRIVREAEERPPFTFTAEQLSLYGVYELQTLEEVLRLDRWDPNRARVLAEVAERIRRKIGWAEPVPSREADRFLSAFYAAQRARLERGMLFGRRKKDKFAPETGPGAAGGAPATRTPPGARRSRRPRGRGGGRGT